MTRYTVVWVRSAVEELAELWLSASDRSSITDAAHAIDLQLADDAPSKGHAVHEDLRGLFEPPLRVLFSIRDDDRLVEVLRVRRL